MKSIFNSLRGGRGRVSANEQSYFAQQQKLKLKTILKNRESHKLQRIVRQPISNRAESQHNKLTDVGIEFADRQLRSSKSLDLNDTGALPGLQQRSRSLSRPPQHRPQVQQSPTYEQLMRVIESLDSEAEELIRRKIAKMSTKQATITLRSKGKDEISSQIETLVAKIKAVRSDHFQNPKISQAQIKQLMDRKINLLQKLLAGNETESEVLKKYFFAISAINQQKKSSWLLKQGASSVGKKLSLRVGRSYEVSKTQELEPVCNQSCNQLEYHSPKPNQYETYRYKAKEWTANPQPLPRSSYSREFLVNPKTDNFSCKNMDNHSLFGRSRFSSSTYSKDFQRVKTEMVDYRELDSYRNKIKDIEVSYNFRNRKDENQKCMEKSRKFLQDQLKQRYQAKAGQAASAMPEPRPECKSHLLVTESQVSFRGEAQGSQSQIKNKQLNSLKYSYRSLINS